MHHNEIIIQDREELFFLLAEAAEFEHSVMCTYLYAMWSLKRGTDEGVTREELAAIEGWRQSLRQVALEEMLHLSLVNNILAATGASPHLWRPDFPVRSGWFPADVVMRLSPFSAATIEHFMYIERPEGIKLVDGAGFDHPAHHPRAARPELLSPTPRDYKSQGQLYHSVLRGLAKLAGTLGEENVFVGHGEAQISGAEFGIPGLFKINDLATARRAVEEIVSQGEGAPAHREGSHYQRFAAISEEFTRLRRARPEFAPARPVVENPSIDNPLAHADVTPITDPLTSKIVDLGNALYALMMRTFAQVFSPAPLPRDLRMGLAAATTDMMFAMTSVGEAATRLPVGRGRPGFNAGLTFALPLSSGQLVQRCAAQILGERARELANAARKLDTNVPLVGVATRMNSVADLFTTLHARFEEHLTAAVDHVAQVAAPHRSAPSVETAGSEHGGTRRDEVTLRYDGKLCIHARHCIVDASAVPVGDGGSWLHAKSVPVAEGVAIARSCPSGAITYERHDGGPQEAPPAVNALRIRENGPYSVHAEIELDGRGAMFRATLCRCGKSANKPFCDNSHLGDYFAASGEPATIESDPLDSRAGPLHIAPVKDGPLQVTGNLEICSGSGRTVFRCGNTRLCRCGGSARKPFCDGSHARIGFRSDEVSRTP
jgi:CDGSH-type Zn-finger protein/uncharacterized Fe-S cluster protein YjdI